MLATYTGKEYCHRHNAEVCRIYNPIQSAYCKLSKKYERASGKTRLIMKKHILCLVALILMLFSASALAAGRDDALIGNEL